MPFCATFITMFKEPLLTLLSSSIIGRAHQKNIIASHIISILETVAGNHHLVDDTPYGGGPGELMKIDVIAPLIDLALKQNAERPREKKRILLMDPAGRQFKQKDALRLSHYEELIFISGRYEGIDARIHHFIDEAISMGDYVVTSGDLPAIAIFEATARMIPGVLGNNRSHIDESHSDGRLEASMYTRPADYRGLMVPEVFQNGNHKEINRAKLLEALHKTSSIRPDLLDKFPVTEQEKTMLLENQPFLYPWMHWHD
jgi:tRNA (guanine37-N1)-methyltransferase